jgi:hypothetical protein
MSFKRDNELVEAISTKLPQMNEETRKLVEKLIQEYEWRTFAEWRDKDEFNANFVEHMVNDCGFDEKVVAEKMAFTHPTLQQSFMRLCLNFIKLMSEKSRFDARNESSVKMAKQIVEAISDISLPMI